MHKVLFFSLISLIFMLFSCKKDNTDPKKDSPYNQIGMYAYDLGINKAADIHQLGDGSGYMILGTYQGYYDSYVSYYLIKTDIDGNVIWGNIYGDTNAVHQPLRVLPKSNGNFYIVGNRIDSNLTAIEVIEVGSAGDTVQLVSLPEVNNKNRWVTATHIQADNSIRMVGTTEEIISKSYNGSWQEAYDVTDYFIATFDPATFSLDPAATEISGGVGSDEPMFVFEDATNLILGRIQKELTNAATASNVVYDRKFYAFKNSTGFTSVHYANVVPNTAVYNFSTGQFLMLGDNAADLVAVATNFDGADYLHNTLRASTGRLKAVSATVLANGNYLITAQLRSGSDVDMYQMEVNDELNILNQKLLGLTDAQEYVAKGIEVDGQRLFVGDVANGAYSGPGAFVNEPDSIVLGKFD